MLPFPLLLRRTIITHWILISSFWRAIFMLFCCLSCDRSFLRPLASLRTDRLLLDTASAVESLRWCYSMTVVCKVDRSSWLFLTICMALPLCVIFLILVSLENVKKCVLGGYTITSKTKINVFWKKILTPLAPSDSTVRNVFKNIDFSLWGKQWIVPRKWDQNCENHT